MSCCASSFRTISIGGPIESDALLNLPAERHSHGLRRLAAIESSRGSFEDAAAAIGRATGQRLGKRQIEDLAGRAACDFDAF